MKEKCLKNIWKNCEKNFSDNKEVIIFVSYWILQVRLII